MLLLALIPSTSLASETPEEEGFLIAKGTVLINEIKNNTIDAFAFRLFYIEVTETERTMGWVTLNHVTFHQGFFMISLGKLSFVIGISPGGLEVE